MTIEASFIVPLMVFILIIIIYWSFYTYNNCVVYQDCYITALRGSQLIDMKQDEIENLLNVYANDLLDNQLFQYQISPQIDVGIINISVSADSYIENLLSTYFNQDRMFTTNRKANSKKINPIALIRSRY